MPQIYLDSIDEAKPVTLDSWGPLPTSIDSFDRSVVVRFENGEVQTVSSIRLLYDTTGGHWRHVADWETVPLLDIETLIGPRWA